MAEERQSKYIQACGHDSYLGKQYRDRHYRKFMLFEANTRQSLCLILGLLGWCVENETSFDFKDAAEFLIILKCMIIIGLIMVTVCSGLAGTVWVYVCPCSKIINSVFFHFQKCSGLDDKYYDLQRNDQFLDFRNSIYEISDQYMQVPFSKNQMKDLVPKMIGEEDPQHVSIFIKG